MTYQLRNGKSITIYEGVVNQRNVFCVQHRTDIINGSSYTVSKEYTVTDPVFAEIIMNRFDYWKSRL